MAINKTLKFSWGHVMALLILITAVVYMSFMGGIYYLEGDWQAAIINAVIIVFIMIILFMTPQLIKATDSKFGKKIVIERLWVFIVWPLVIVLYFHPLVPSTHAWTVIGKRADIEPTFENAVKSVKGMFVSYEDYAEERIKSYEETLCNRDDLSLLQKDIKVEALRIQLLGENYDRLKTEAYKWIDYEVTGVTVFNPFVMGNIKKIDRALTEWNTMLSNFSKKILSDERNYIKAFDLNEKSVRIAKTELNKLHIIFSLKGNISIDACLFNVVMFFLLIFPYLLQNRNIKSGYRLFGMTKKSTIGGIVDDMNINNTNKDNKKTNNGGYKTFTIE